MLNCTNPVISVLPSVLIDVVCDMAWGTRWALVSHDLSVCAEAQEKIAPLFLKDTLLLKDGYGSVANPFKKFMPFTPLELVVHHQPFGFFAGAICYAICRQKIRSLKTYRGICMRRAMQLMHGNLYAWNEAYTNLFKHLDSCHFRNNARKGMVVRYIAEVREAGPIMNLCTL